jgi:hypothetical protein
MKSRYNFSQHRHLIHPIGLKTHVLGRFGLFRYCTNFGAKRAELVQVIMTCLSNHYDEFIPSS